MYSRVTILSPGQGALLYIGQKTGEPRSCACMVMKKYAILTENETSFTQPVACTT
jgi:hypothetical protein